MSNVNQYIWADFYKKFVNKLLAYKNKRHEFIAKVKSIYEETGINLPTLNRGKQIIDIDPFTVAEEHFGLTA